MGLLYSVAAFSSISGQHHYHGRILLNKLYFEFISE